MIATVFLMLGGVYCAGGLLFAAGFVCAGVNRVDPAAARGSLGFRLLIIPGAMVFWPLLWRRWAKGRHAPEPGDAHRRAARKGTVP